MPGPQETETMSENDKDTTATTATTADPAAQEAEIARLRAELARLAPAAGRRRPVRVEVHPHRSRHAHEAHAEPSEAHPVAFADMVEKHPDPKIGGYVSIGAVPVNKDIPSGGGVHAAPHAHDAHPDFHDLFEPHRNPEIGGWVSRGTPHRTGKFPPGQ